MTAAHWARIKTIVAGVLSEPHHTRRAYLAARCEGDTALQREVESMLAAAEQAASLYEEPAIVVGGDTVGLESLGGMVSSLLASGSGRSTIRRIWRDASLSASS